MRIITGLCVCVCALAAFAADAPKLSAKAQARVKAETEKLREMGKEPELAKAVETQNTKKLTPVQVIETDKQWMAKDPKIESLVRELMNNDCAKHLKTHLAKDAAYVEFIVMDQLGANVCITSRTSDYWQGDEDKWRKSYANGKGGTDVSAPLYDESAKAWVVQVSVPVVDEKKKVIGAVCVGLKVDELEKTAPAAAK